MILYFIGTSQNDVPMIIFCDEICIKPSKYYNYKTCHTIFVKINDNTIIIPKDFITDLASVPRVIWPVLSPTRSDLMSSSVLHDYLYACHNGLKRKEIDNIFYYSLIEKGVSPIIAYEMYFSVRFFGARHFTENKNCNHFIERNLINESRRKVRECSEHCIKT